MWCECADGLCSSMEECTGACCTQFNSKQFNTIHTIQNRNIKYCFCADFWNPPQLFFVSEVSVSLTTLVCGHAVAKLAVEGKLNGHLGNCVGREFGLLAGIAADGGHSGCDFHSFAAVHLLGGCDAVSQLSVEIPVHKLECRQSTQRIVSQRTRKSKGGRRAEQKKLN